MKRLESDGIVEKRLKRGFWGWEEVRDESVESFRGALIVDF